MHLVRAVRRSQTLDGKGFILRDYLSDSLNERLLQAAERWSHYRRNRRNVTKFAVSIEQRCFGRGRIHRYLRPRRMPRALDIARGSRQARQLEVGIYSVKRLGVA
jgi:hypothetical protein